MGTATTDNTSKWAGHLRDRAARCRAEADRLLDQRQERVVAAVELTATIDFATSTIGELQTLQDVAQILSKVAYALSWWPSCHGEPKVRGGPDFNEAGRLLDWLGAQLSEVEGRAIQEAARRTPQNLVESNARLCVRAFSIIGNGDLSQIEAFSRELLNYVKAEREEH